MLDRRLILPRIAAALLATFAALPAAHAAAPAPLSNPNYGFPLPGDYVTPASAASAGLSLADRWLGDTPFENPAARVHQGVQLSPVFQRVSRQDLTSQNRDVDQNAGYLDAVSGSVSFALRTWNFSLYAWQPVLRLEQQAYSQGPIASPALIDQQALQRELRAGLALSRGFGEDLRIGVSAEYVTRKDSYETHEQSGGPNAGDRVLEFDGSSLGFGAGFAYARDPDKPWGSWLGAAVHYTSQLDVSGTLTESFGTGGGAVSGSREAEMTGGVSARVTIAPATRFVAGISARTGADWTGWDLGTGSAASYAVGIDWKDDELPWGARFGVGQESNPDAVERKAGLLSLGFTWVSGDLVLDLGLIHRNLDRDGFPHSADDRAVGSIRVAF
ncbi:MAG: hypothetical protein ABL977_03895 [Candidatus Eisenbacteria bacterium]